MSQRWGPRRRTDPPARKIPAEPERRSGAPPAYEARQRAKSIRAEHLETEFFEAAEGDIGTITAGTLQSEDETLLLELATPLLTVTDEQTTPVDRIYLGKLGPSAEDYGIEVYDEAGAMVLGATGLGDNVVGATNLSAINLGIGKYVRSNSYTPGSDGFTIEAGGSAEFNDIVARGTIFAEAGEFAGTLMSPDGTIGTITAGTLRDTNTRMVVSLDTPRITVTDENAQDRLYLGYLGGDGTAYGLEIHDHTGTLLFGATGETGATYAGSLDAVDGTFDTITAGLLRSADSLFQIDLTNKLLTITDEDAQDRVQLGDFGGGTADYGIKVWNDVGALVLGINGLGDDVVGAANISALNFQSGKYMRSETYTPGSAGWSIEADGTAEFDQITARGNITATAGTIGGWTIGATTLASSSGGITLDGGGEDILIGDATSLGSGAGIFIGKTIGGYDFRVGDPAGAHMEWDGSAGTLQIVGGATFSGKLSAAGGTFSGDLSAAGGTFEGTLSGVDGTFSGTLSAVDGTFGTITAGTLSGTNVTLDLDAAGSDVVMSWPGGAFDAAGNFALGDILSGGDGLAWDQGSGALTISGTIGSDSEIEADTFTAPTAHFTAVVQVGDTPMLELQNFSVALSGGIGVLRTSGNNLLIEAPSGELQFTQNSPPSVTGSRAGNAALASLLTALDGRGLVADNTT